MLEVTRIAGPVTWSVAWRNKREGRHDSVGEDSGLAHIQVQMNTQLSFADSLIPFQAIISKMSPRLAADPDFLRRIMTDYPGLDLEKEAIKFLDWCRVHRIKYLTAPRVFNWLDKAKAAAPVVAQEAAWSYACEGCGVVYDTLHAAQMCWKGHKIPMRPEDPGPYRVRRVMP